MTDQHIVFAVLQNNDRVRVSMPTSYDSALDKWNVLDDAVTEGKKPSVQGEPVSYFVVRSADDPAWPASGPIHRVRVPKSATPTSMVMMYNGENVPAKHRYICRLTSPKGAVMAGCENPITAQALAYAEARRENIL